MEKLGLLILVWVICIMIFRTYIRLYVLKKYSFFLEKLSIDRLLLFLPEIFPLKDIKYTQDLLLKKIYRLIFLYKFIFWVVFLFIFIILMVN